MACCYGYLAGLGIMAFGQKGWSWRIVSSCHQSRRYPQLFNASISKVRLIASKSGATPTASAVACRGHTPECGGSATPIATILVRRTSAVRLARVDRTGNPHSYYQRIPSPVGFPYGFWRDLTENLKVLNTRDSLNATGDGAPLFRAIGHWRTRS